VRVKSVRLAVGIAALALAPIAARAQNLEPRAYANTPIGMNFALVGYDYIHGDVSTDASLPLQNGKVQVNGAWLGYAHTFDFLGQSAKLAAVLPYGWAWGSASFDDRPFSRNVNGLGDATVKFSTNLYGAPALSLEDFQNYEQDLIVGASVSVTAPIGQYDSDFLLNIGSHRWAFRPEIGVSKSFDPLILEVSAAGSFYTDNHDFFREPAGLPHPGAQHSRSQDPIGSAQAHAIYSFRRTGIWGSLDFTYYTGGATRIDGGPAKNLQSNTRLGGTLAFPVNRYNSIKIYGSTGVSQRTGGHFDAIGIAWQVRWGGGL